MLTTPNLARLTNILRLLSGRPILYDPQLTCLPAKYCNEHIHRREYVASEIVDAIRKAGLAHLMTRYVFTPGPHRRSLKARAYGLLSALHPRFKNVMLLAARKDS